MHTDEDLTTRLGGAFRGATEDLTYSGTMPRARRTPSTAWLTVPAVAAVATIAVVGGQSGDEAPISAGPDASTSTSQGASSETVTDSVELVGVTYQYTRGAQDEPLVDDFTIRPGQAPADAKSIELEPGASAKAWVGVDPQTGDNALWIDSPVRFDGESYVMSTPTWSLEQLEDLALNGWPDSVDLDGELGRASR